MFKKNVTQLLPWIDYSYCSYILELIVLLLQALIYKEFFSQGDMEKAKGLEPSDMMDRERAQIPALQISFLDHVALPVYV